MNTNIENNEPAELPEKRATEKKTAFGGFDGVPV
jgi:hypothetical protein